MFKKQSKPMPENITTRTTQTEIEDKSDNRSSTEDGLPNSGFFDHERKQIALEESEARYRRLFETAKDGILILDGDTGRNRSAYSLGASPSNMASVGYDHSLSWHRADS